MVDFKSQSACTLLALAGRRNGIDCARCDLAFARLGSADRLRSDLRSALARHRLSDLQFAVLVVLFEREPEPVPMAVQAERAGVSRSAATDALDTLDALRLASRTRDHRDRRVIQVRITAAGRAKVDRAINDYLQVASHASCGVEEEGRATPLSSAGMVRGSVDPGD